jgi:hypothetical protein
MADLPELSDLTKRKLTLRWSALLDNNQLTGEHLQWHLQWQEGEYLLSQFAAQISPGRGLRASVTVSERRLKDLIGEYWGLWTSSGDGFEVFVDYLRKLQEQVAAEIASVWRGNSEAIDGWYETACRPAVEKALSALVKQGINRARAAELKRLEARIPTAEGGFPKANQIDATEPGVNESDRAEEGPGINGKGTDWRPVIDAFISTVKETTGHTITRKDICTVAGYESRTEFERFQRGSTRTTRAASKAFNRVLTMDPKHFIESLKKIRGKN